MLLQNRKSSLKGFLNNGDILRWFLNFFSSSFEPLAASWPYLPYVCVGHIGLGTSRFPCFCTIRMTFWYASSLCRCSSTGISFPPLSQKVYFLGCIRGMGIFTKKNITSLLILCPSCIKIRDNLLDIWTVPKSTLFGIFYGDSDFVVERAFYDILSHCFSLLFDF